MLAFSGYVVHGHVIICIFAQLLGVSVTSSSAQMSMFGRTPAAPSGGVNHERIEMAINE